MRPEMAMSRSYINTASMTGVALCLIIAIMERRAIRWHASQR